jgi:hypothetical protein
VILFCTDIVDILVIVTIPDFTNLPSTIRHSYHRQMETQISILYGGHIVLLYDVKLFDLQLHILQRSSGLCVVTFDVN